MTKKRSKSDDNEILLLDDDVIEMARIIANALSPNFFITDKEAINGSIKTLYGILTDENMKNSINLASSIIQKGIKQDG
jgi:hypothetical protein